MKRRFSFIFLDVSFSGINVYVQTYACSIFDGVVHCVLPNDVDTVSSGKRFCFSPGLSRQAPGAHPVSGISFLGGKTTGE